MPVAVHGFLISHEGGEKAGVGFSARTVSADKNQIGSLESSRFLQVEVIASVVVGEDNSACGAPRIRAPRSGILGQNKTETQSQRR